MTLAARHAAHHAHRPGEAGIHRVSRLGIVNEYLVAEDDWPR